MVRSRSPQEKSDGNRESGGNPGQSRCCKFLFRKRKAKATESIFGKARFREQSQKTCH